MVELNCAIENGTLPPAYHNHPLVLSDVDTPATPISIYLDGTPYQKRDSELCLVPENTPTSKRHILAIQRKLRMCLCCCEDLCSLRALFRSLA